MGRSGMTVPALTGVKDRRLWWALVTVTAGSAGLGVAGVGFPLAWSALPLVWCQVLRWRLALLVCVWALALIGVSIALPVVPGHQGDPFALFVSVLVFAAGVTTAWSADHQRPLLTPTDGRAHARRVGGACLLSAGSHQAALAERADRRRGEPVASVADWTVYSRGGIRLLVGEIQADHDVDRTVVARLRSCFQAAAGTPDRGLAAVATELDRRLRVLVPGGHLAATLVEMCDHRMVRVLSCGGPHPVICHPDGRSGWFTAGSTEPIGLLRGPAGPQQVLPPGATLAVFTPALAWPYLAAGDLDRLPARIARVAHRGPVHGLTGLRELHTTRAPGQPCGPLLVISTRLPLREAPASPARRHASTPRGLGARLRRDNRRNRRGPRPPTADPRRQG